MAITASEARRSLFPLIEQVNNDNVAVEITSRKGSAFLVSAAEWESLQETAHLLRSPANAARLTEAIAQVRSGQVQQRELIDPDA